MAEQYLLKCPCCGKTSSTRWWNKNELRADASWLIHQKVGGKSGIETLGRYTPKDIISSDNEDFISALAFVRDRLLHAVCLLVQSGFVSVIDLREMNVTLLFNAVGSLVENCEVSDDDPVKSNSRPGVDDDVCFDDLLTGVSAAKDGGFID